MAPTTLRRHFATLVDAGLIIRNDGPNGKRYARKGEGRSSMRCLSALRCSSRERVHRT
jgi:DNA-binding transcriptional ArsR family regulator